MSLYVGDRLVCKFGWNKKGTVPQVGYLQELNCDARSTKHKKLIQLIFS